MTSSVGRWAVRLLLCLTAITSQILARAPPGRMSRRAPASTELGEFLQLGEATGPLKTTRQSGSVMIECEFMGSPPPVVQWLRGKAVHAQDRPSDKLAELRSELSGMEPLPLDSATSIGTTRARLYLDCVSPADQGEYTCQGRTPSEVTSSTTQLYVTEPLSEESILACEEAKGSPFQAVRVVQWRPKILAMMGTQARLVCITSGFPAPSISWTRNYQPLETGSGRITVTPSGDLIIDDLQWSDMGQYQCIASNEISSDSVTTFLYPFKAGK
ncbi:neural/ectodermal development factor IMP-L2-like [Amphibalanus amphitrite]|uniref:neural/ectodermal development factor IMP-L2-like n=1 Tax=Amphibalanus amphitrite TaxID=1232801 RepID=UPI001C9289DA|nr:neural/ectodermal development factor IMP-L2-like [Amphibalanus amphitrite]